MAKPGPNKVDKDTAAARREAAKNETLFHHAKEGNQKAKDAVKDNAKGGKG